VPVVIEMEQFEVLLFCATLVFFTGWLSWLSHKIARTVDGLDQGGIEHSERVAEIRDAVSIVGEVLENLPHILKEQTPQFNMNSSPFAPIVEMIMSNMSGKGGLSTLPTPRAPDGTFSGETQNETEETPI